MSKQTEALKLALELALDVRANSDARLVAKAIALTNVIDAALAEQPAQQQEPVAWHGYDLDGMVEAFDRVIEVHYNSKQPFHSPVDSDARMALRILRGFIPSMKRYTSPPASKPWVGLTNQELIDLTAIYSGAPLYCAIEAKLREKNA